MTDTPTETNGHHPTTPHLDLIPLPDAPTSPTAPAPSRPPTRPPTA
ncbi:hypothetical protein ACFQX6_43055 [Streptosporangium lutulentum]